MEVFNFLLYFILTYYIWKKHRGAHVALLISSMWAFSSLCGIYYNGSEVFRDGVNTVSFMPFLYLFLCLFIFITPLIKIEANEYKIISGNADFVNVVNLGICMIGILPFLEIIIQMVQMIIDGRIFLIGAMYDDIATGYDESFLKLSKLSYLFISVLKGTKIISLLLFFYYLQQENKKIYILIGLFTAAITPALFNICYGNRTEMIWFVLYFIALYLLFRNSYENKTKRILNSVTLFTLGFILVAFAILSFSRFTSGDKYGEFMVEDYLMQYTAESMYNFNQNVFHEGASTEGMMTVYPILYSFGFIHVERDMWGIVVSSLMKGKANVFYTLFGDFVADYGLLATLLIVIIICYLIKKIKFSEVIELENLLLFAIYLYIALAALFYFCFKMTYAPLYYTLGFYVLLKINKLKK